MKNTTSILIAAVLAVAGIQACKKENAMTAGARVPVLPESVLKYNEIPGNSGVLNPFGSVQVDDQVATLGRVLFYETQLSINNSTSCGSCHSQAAGFATNNKLEPGFNGAMTTRNAPAITNPGTQSSYFWDMRESNLAAMVTQPISNHVEMGLEEPEYMAAKVRNLPYYEPLFTQAFGDAAVTPARIGSALSHFVASMISVRSKFDDGVATGFTNFTAQENLGRQLFTSTLPCSQCHGGENFAGAWGGSQMENIGLETDYEDNGIPGLDWMTGSERDGWFKVPSLRNVAITAPYMHDGRFATLEEVVDFYNSGIEPHSQLSFSLREGWNGGGGVILEPFEGDGEGGNVNGVAPLRMQLNTGEKQALVAFLRTLTDESIIRDEKFADPFVLIAQ